MTVLEIARLPLAQRIALQDTLESGLGGFAIYGRHARKATTRATVQALVRKGLVVAGHRAWQGKVSPSLTAYRLTEEGVRALDYMGMVGRSDLDRFFDYVVRTSTLNGFVQA